jgi:predicted 2-oxoglutarate/Fe(II)-dependent dioxygenase YbiX/peroxiredoxin
MSLPIGAPAPWFQAASPSNPRFSFASLGGVYVVLAFLPPPGPERDAALKAVMDHKDLFREGRCVFFGVLSDAESCAQAQTAPPLRWFFDPDGELARLYKVFGPDGVYRPQWIAIDPMLRVLGTAPIEQSGSVLSTMASLGLAENHAGVPIHAPVLIVPRVLEPDLCRRLIDLYNETGGAPSGVMRQVDGKTVPMLDDFKRRRDANIADEGLRSILRSRIVHRLLPEIKKAFQFEATRIERYIVACYDASDGGYFRAHRDNTTTATAHRRFAVSINLNAEEFEGGDLRFPEFGAKTYRPPTGGAVVFSCSLLHEATPVNKGTRYATLPFLFDEAAEEIRAANAHTLVQSAPATDDAAASAG